jgi:hypothetical protein
MSTISDDPPRLYAVQAQGGGKSFGGSGIVFYYQPSGETGGVSGEPQFSCLKAMTRSPSSRTAGGSAPMRA